MIKIDIYPVKICSRDADDPKKLESIVSIVPEAVEDSFKENSETAPTVNINVCVDSNKPEDIEYLHSMNWFTTFYLYSGVYKLINRVNFACNIVVNKEVEFSDDTKDALNHMFEHFVEKFKETVEDAQKHVTIWSNDPAFTITIADPEEQKEVKEEDVVTDTNDNSISETGV